MPLILNFKKKKKNPEAWLHHASCVILCRYDQTRKSSRETRIEDLNRSLINLHESRNSHKSRNLENAGAVIQRWCIDDEPRLTYKCSA
jgi:hypothetical protein